MSSITGPDASGRRPFRPHSRMKLPNFISSFRARLMLVFAMLLVATLGVQYYLNLRNGRENRQIRERAEQAFRTGVALGIKGISSKDTLVVLRKKANNPTLDPQTGRVTNIVIVDSQWRVIDTLDPRYFPKVLPDGSYQYFLLKDMTTLPPLMDDV